MGRNQTIVYPRNYRHVMAAIGDSLTKPEAGPVGLGFMWPHIVANKLQLAGCSIMARDLARDGCKTGNLSPGMVYRLLELNLYNSPTIGVIWGGTNDRRTISGITRSGTTATATSNGHGYQTGDILTIAGADQAGYNLTKLVVANALTNTFDYTVDSGTVTPATGTLIYANLQTLINIRALILAMKFNCIAAVQNPTDLPANANPGDRYVVLEDNSSTGGLERTMSYYTAKIAGSVSGSAPSVWESRNPNASVTGWGRVATSATTPTHTKKFLVVGQHYLNYSSGGDNSSTATVYSPYNTSTGVRSYQIAAVAAENYDSSSVIYVDTYAYLQGLITATQETQGSASWHVADGNVHPNILGHEYIAEAVFAAIPTTWYPDLT